jgi:GTP-binding protein
MEGYFGSERNIGLVFQLVDMRHPPTQNDLAMIDFLIDAELPFVIVLTKKDKLSSRQQAERLAALQTEIPCADQITMIPFSAETGEGCDQVRAIIEELAASEKEELESSEEE